MKNESNCQGKRIILSLLIGLCFLSGTELTAQAFTATITDAFSTTCAGGSIDLTINTGVPPYEVVWRTQSGAIIQEATDVSATAAAADLLGVEPGSYTVEVTDALCGTASAVFTVLNRLEVSVAITNPVACSGSDCDGAIELSFSGAAANQIRWSTGDITSPATGLSGLCAGEYAFTVTDGAGCEYSETVELVCCLTVELISLRHAGTSAGDGRIHLSVSGGSGTIESIKLNGVVEDDLIFGSLTPGTYTVEILDENGCLVTRMYEIIDCPVANTTDEIDLALAVTQIGSSAGLPGGAAVETAGFSPPLTVNWVGPGGFSSSNPAFTTSVPGTYRATVEDACGNQSSATARIGDCEGYLAVDSWDRCIDRFNFTRSWFQVGDLYTDNGILNQGETAQAQISFTPAASGIPQILFNGPVNVFQNAPRRYGFSHIGNKYYISDPGTVRITITTQAGCVFQQVLGFGLDSEVFNAYVESINSGYVTDNPSLLIQNEFTTEEFFITGFYGCKSCWSQEEIDQRASNGTGQLCGKNPQIYIFDYEPIDRSRPCTGGGILTYNMGGEQTIEVPENILSQSFQAGNDCACLFPYGIIRKPMELLQFQPNFAYEVAPRPIYVEFSCVDKEDEEAGVEIEVSDGEFGVICARFECPGNNCRVVLSADGCSYDLICASTGTVLLPGIYDSDPDGDPSDEQQCFYIDEGFDEGDDPLIVIGIPCVTDKCNLDGFYPLDYRPLEELETIANTYADCGIGSCRKSRAEREIFSKKLRTEMPAETKLEITRSQAALSLNIFPNPLDEANAGPFTLVSNRKLSEIRLYNANGRMVNINTYTDQGFIHKINILDRVPNGLYIVRVLTSSGDILSKKLLVN